jgi:sporulation protein YlmC with PRC-barrel domain
MSTSLKSLRKRKIVDTSDASTIGRVKDICIDTSGPSVAAVVVKGADGDAIAFGDLIAIGADALTVGDASVVAREAPDLPRASDAYGTRVLDDAGRELGKVEDIQIEDDGRISGVVVGGVTHTGRLLGVGSYAVVVARA